jgi:hypothetical protein
MKVKNLVALLQTKDMELDIVLDDGHDGAFTNIFVEPVVEEFETIGYTLMGDDEPVEDKQLKLPFDGTEEMK